LTVQLRLPYDSTLMTVWMPKVEREHEKEIFNNYNFVLGQLFSDELCGFKIYQSLGVYEGSFDGVRYGGTIRIHLYQTPEGDKLFRATVIIDPFEPDVGIGLFVRGKMTANLLEGEFQGNASGILSGQLSSDGNQYTGSFNLTDLNSGTWQAKKK